MEAGNKLIDMFRAINYSNSPFALFFFDPLRVNLLTKDSLHPLQVLQVPVNGFFQAGHQCFGGLPT